MLCLTETHTEVFQYYKYDCWGGQIYRQLRLQNKTPTVGLYINPSEYLNFLKNLHRKDANILEFIDTNKDFPVARNPYATLFFMHYKSEKEAKEKFTRRFDRINWDNVLIKIDFGKQGFTNLDIEDWNSIKMPNSVAFYSPSRNLPEARAHNGVLIPDWVPSGGMMFNITRRYFDLYTWINKGTVTNSFFYRVIYLLFLDPTVLRRITNKVFHLTSILLRR